jgi:hypothetical protein
MASSSLPAGGLGELLDHLTPSNSAGIDGKDRYMVASVEIAVLTLRELS